MYQTASGPASVYGGGAARGLGHLRDEPARPAQQRGGGEVGVLPVGDRVEHVVGARERGGDAVTRLRGRAAAVVDELHAATVAVRDHEAVGAPACDGIG